MGSEGKGIDNVSRNVNESGQGECSGETVLNTARNVSGALCSDSTRITPVERQTLAQKLLTAPVDLESEFVNEIEKLCTIKDQLPYQLKSLLDAFIPTGECDGSIYYNGFLDTLEIVLDFLGDNHLVDGICWVMSRIRSSDTKVELEFSPRIYTACFLCGAKADTECTCPKGPIPF